jgi:asparagine synthase (glutamine-hydrolysing)
LSDVLPKEILYRKKRGFGAPMGAWFKQELTSVLNTVLSKEAVIQRGLFDWKSVDETIRMHASSRADHTDHLQSMLNLELWCLIYLDGRSPDDLADQLQAECTP